MSFTLERRLWNEDVDIEAAKLVRKGIPPYEALGRAESIVSTRRREEGGEREWKN